MSTSRLRCRRRAKISERETFLDSRAAEESEGCLPRLRF